MKKIINIPLIVIALLMTAILTSCEKEIDVDLNSVTPRLVIEGLVVKDSIAKVKLTKTKDFNDNNVYEPITGASIQISDDAGNTETLLLNSTGWYVAKTLKGVEGRTYKLTVLYDEQTYTSTSKMPPVVKIDSLSMFDFKVLDYWLPRVHFKDPVGTTNDYYRAKLYVNDKYIPCAYEAISMDRSDGIEYVNLCFPDEKKLVDEEIKKGDRLKIELQRLDKGAYTYFYPLDVISDSNNNPTSNITGGALGYFSAYSYDRQEIIADWED